MLCLGFSGGLNRVYENPFDLPNAFTHDGAAVIVEDGKVIAAVEEERLNRIKHSNKFPTRSIRYCLESAGAKLEDIDRIAFYATEDYCNSLLGKIYIDQPTVTEKLDARTVMRALLQQEFGTEVESDRIFFARHHMAHAMSTFAMSGFEESLVLVIDGYGDFLSGLVAVGKGTSLTEIETFAQDDSLGLLYLGVIRFLGYGPFDEYKVMGLAPYGKADEYRPLMNQLYELLDDGGYRIFLDRISPTLIDNINIRKKGQPFTDQHKNLAASLQEALEIIVFHILEHRRKSIGLENLCLAGGVAHNCTMNGKLLYSGMFEDIFIQPASHDAGCALGAALISSSELGYPPECERLKDVYWGPDIGESATIEQELKDWETFLDFERPPDIANYAAKLMNEGAVIGWVQGKSEFGPRALGNRSILADPRPESNKDRINKMVKKREGYRPFAPSVLEEFAHEYFDLPTDKNAFPFMIFVVKVLEDKRKLLGAITHIDGTARPQTVSRETNPSYWDLINAFKDLTGVPILLNTSFNNNVEPIIDSKTDAVVTFLTTELDYLAIGSYIASKRSVTTRDWLSLQISLPSYVQLHQTRSFVNLHQMQTKCEIRTSYSALLKTSISDDAYYLLSNINEQSSIKSLLTEEQNTGERLESIVNEFCELWAKRLICLNPLTTTKSGQKVFTRRN